MNESAIHVMVWAEIPVLMAELESQFIVHNRAEIKDLAGWGAAEGPKIEAVITNGMLGTEVEVLEFLPNLKVVCSMGVGYDAIDTGYLSHRGIPVSNTPDVLNDAVAEAAMALMLCLTRRISQAERFIRQGAWGSQTFPAGYQLTGKTCGMVGLGKIGRTIARRAEAFGMNIAYYRRGGPYANLDYRHCHSIIELATEADYLVVIVPGGPDTRHLINDDVLAALGRNSYLINVSRGSVVDEAALIASLQTGGIAGAALDVFKNEPLVPEELIEMDNVILTPHLGSSTHETRQAMADLVLANLRQFFNDGTLITPIN
ncbi:2-hydroxyacid dehydrogenase [Pseudomonas putida]|uniref:2-hydroxyacid dehydrogenase n=1 Tax=Pseudomonas putida TaxID=303 RepID=UPI001075357D|nr:2-hydroxyacid dehydrogenase [Pseudomonas putida]TFW39766.1 2-hydroxyacid dehydrogenase [Pseudomonas putida]